MKSIILSKKLLDAEIKEIETSLKVRIIQKNKRTLISGSELNEYVCLQVLKALSLGMNLEDALLLKNPDYSLRTINLKNSVRESRLKTIKSRIIGTKGRTLHNLESLTNCRIVLKNSMLVIIGESQSIGLIIHAINMIIRGLSHSQVYSFLEKSRKSMAEEELLLYREHLE